MRKFSLDTWKTGGEVVKMAELDTQHLINARNYHRDFCKPSRRLDNGKPNPNYSLECSNYDKKQNEFKKEIRKRMVIKLP